VTSPLAQVLEHTSLPAATGEPGPSRPGRPGGPPGWFPRGDRARAALAVIRREWVAGAFALSAVFALVTALTSFNAPERVWGAFAAVSYAVSAVTAAVVRRRGVSVAVLISLAGAVAAPLARMAVTGMAQPEVAVIIRSAAMLVHQGTPYASPAALAARQGSPRPRSPRRSLRAAYSERYSRRATHSKWRSLRAAYSLHAARSYRFVGHHVRANPRPCHAPVVGPG
jgi:hypothetical protein